METAGLGSACSLCALGDQHADVLHLATDGHRGLLKEGFLLSSFPRGQSSSHSKGSYKLGFPQGPVSASNKATN